MGVKSEHFMAKSLAEKSSDPKVDVRSLTVWTFTLLVFGVYDFSYKFLT